MSLCQTAVVRIVTVLFTRLTLSLTRPSLRTSVRPSSPECAGSFQVFSMMMKTEFRIRFIQGHHKAKIETDFSYKACCNDASQTLSVLNTTKLAAKTCSERVCFYSDALVHSTWISHQVCPIPLVLWEIKTDIFLRWHFLTRN